MKLLLILILSTQFIFAQKNELNSSLEVENRLTEFSDSLLANHTDTIVSYSNQCNNCESKTRYLLWREKEETNVYVDGEKVVVFLWVSKCYKILISEKPVNYYVEFDWAFLRTNFKNLLLENLKPNSMDTFGKNGQTVKLVTKIKSQHYTVSNGEWRINQETNKVLMLDKIRSALFFKIPWRN